MTGAEVTNGASQALVTLSHAADFYKRYPGEEITLYTRLVVERPIPGFVLRIGIPHSLQLIDYRASNGTLNGASFEVPIPLVEMGDGLNFLVWRIDEAVPEGAIYEYQTQVEVLSCQQTVTLESRARIFITVSGDQSFRVEDTISLMIEAKSAYLKYLPGIYYRDELMGRFLMLFESFLAPIEGQLDNLPFYFDPALVPADLLSWLASWLNLVLDDNWPEDKRRKLLQEAIHLYRKRGTKAGLQRYLEIYTGQPAQIIEYRANNFQLGPDARLGRGIALGTANQPHTFKVVLRLPPISATDEAEATRQTLEHRQTIETIIETEKPAHTTYTLEIEPADAEARTERNGR